MLLLQNARIWTGDPSTPWLDQLFISDGRVAHSGSPVERIDLGGLLVTPGLWDSHLHLFDWSLSLQQVDLSGCTSLAQFQQRLQGAIPGAGGWVRGQGWNETGWPEGGPTRHHLDEVVQAPCLLWRADLHTVVLNTEALKISGLWQRSPDLQVEGGEIEWGRDGKPNGVVRELAILLLRPWLANPSAGELRDSLLQAQVQLHRYGITGVCDQRLKDYPEGASMLRALAALEREGKLNLRVSCNVPAHELESACRLGLTQGLGSSRLRVGHVKFFCDGSLGSLTARMLKPFRDRGDCGLYLTPPDELEAGFRRAAEAGFAVSVHAIGDRANRECLDLLEQLPRLAVPHRIEHVQFLDPADSERLARADITASMQPGHILDDMDRVDEQLGERAGLAYRLASLAACGTRLSFGSDGPVSRVDVGYGLQGAVQRQRSQRLAQGPWGGEGIDLTTALRAYTDNAAQAAGFGHCGRLTVGQAADLVVFEENFFDFPASRPLEELRVARTMVAGQWVWSSNPKG